MKESKTDSQRVVRVSATGKKVRQTVKELSGSMQHERKWHRPSKNFQGHCNMKESKTDSQRVFRVSAT